MRGHANPGLLSDILPLALLAGAGYVLLRTPAGGGPSLLTQLMGSMGAAPALPVGAADVAPGMGEAFARVFLDGQEVFNTPLVVNAITPYAQEHNVTIGPPGGGPVKTGAYTYGYVSGGPPGTRFMNVSAAPDPVTLGPSSLTQLVTPGGVVTFIYNFASA